MCARVTAPAVSIPRNPRVVQVHPRDDVAVAVEALEPGDTLNVGGATLTVNEAIGAGHKIALRAIAQGQPVHKYGWPIGRATLPIAAGDWVHSHNLGTALTGAQEYSYAPIAGLEPAPVAAMPTWEGYLRANGRVG